MKTIKILAQKKNSIVELVEIDGEEFVAKYYLTHSRSMCIELNILACCQHENIISLYSLEKFIPKQLNDNSPNSPLDTIAMIMVKEDINLVDIIYDRKYTLLEGLDYLLQIAYGIEYLHCHQIAHLDLKSENIMVTNQKCKIIDFGCAEFQLNKKIYTSQTKCTVTHRPPEAFNRNEDKLYVLDKYFDIWSFGIIIFEIFFAMPMYIYLHNKLEGRKSDNDIHQFIISEKFRNDFFNIVPKNLHMCIDLDPVFRPEIKDVISSLITLRTFLSPVTATLSSQKLELPRSLLELPRSLLELPRSLLELPRSLMTIETIPREEYDIYYRRILINMQKNYPLCRQIYLDIIIRSTFELIYQLSIKIGKNKITKQYVEQSIRLCYYFNDTSDIPFDDIFFCKNNNDSQVINEIIMVMNGVLFWPFEQKR